MAVYKLVICYDGTDFHGWQRQNQLRTVQGVIEETLKKLTGQDIKIVGAGRTDAGVHAQGQVAHFRARLSMKEADLGQALNALLPWDVKLVSLRRMPADFHARRSAFSKLYEYHILNSRRVSPFLFRYVLPWPYPLNLSKMQAAARLFVREADFSAFTPHPPPNPVRSVYFSEVKKKGSMVIYRIEANGFLRYMVRMIVGTLLEVGRDRLTLEEVEEWLGGKKPCRAMAVAPAKGLCLKRVIYEPKLRPMTIASSTGLE